MVLVLALNMTGVDMTACLFLGFHSALDACARSYIEHQAEDIGPCPPTMIDGYPYTDFVTYLAIDTNRRAPSRD